MREWKLGKPTREAYGETLLEIGEEYKEIVVLDADLSKSTYTFLFGKKFPDRFFNFGIAEANMVSAAAGLAASGKIPFCSSFACFMINKAYEQIKIGIAGSNLNVKFVASHAGISVGEDGFTQQSVEDIALMATFPGFVIVAPADEFATRWAVKECVKHKGPVYIRTGRPRSPIIYNENTKFEWKKTKVLEEGDDVTIISYGFTLHIALDAHDELLKKGIKARVIDFYTIKPLDEETLLKAAKETKGIVVIEEHLLNGGLGSMIARFLSDKNPCRIKVIGLDDTYGESGTPYELFKKFGLTVENVIKKVEEIISNG
ncbi:MAG: transketolase C-terminal domain-containing protein [candidate division WOR-3 bacterium]